MQRKFSNASFLSYFRKSEHFLVGLKGETPQCKAVVAIPRLFFTSLPLPGSGGGGVSGEEGVREREREGGINLNLSHFNMMYDVNDPSWTDEPRCQQKFTV